MFTSAWTNVNDPIGRANGVFIVFNNHDCVAKIAKTYERFDEAMVIALMQADARLVEYVQRSHKTGTYLACQTNALCFSACQCCCCARQGEIVETNGQQESKPRVNFFGYAFSNHLVAVAQLQTLQEFSRISYGQIADLAETLSIHLYGKRSRL